MRTKLIAFLLVVALFGGGFYGFSQSDDDDTSRQRTSPTTLPPVNNQSSPQSVQDQPETKKTIRIAAMGDMLPHDTVNLRATTSGGYNYLPFFKPVKNQVADADIVFCNQESPSGGSQYGISGYPTFNAPAEFSRDLNNFGCNVINLANNHIADKGQAAIDSTLQEWQKLSALAVGGANSSQKQQDTVSYFEVEGMKFAFIAFTDLSNNGSPNGYSVNMFSDSLVTKLATEASANADYVIASAHWGVEDSPVVSDAQRSWATLMAKNGVDLIIGTGPHVLQPVDKINDTTVFYSIGNFLSSQLLIEELVGGIAYIDIPIGGGEPTLSFLPTYMSYTWSAAEAAAGNLLARDNLSINPLDKSSSLIEQSLFNTTSAQQLTRVTKLLNKNIPIDILSSN